MNQHLQRSQRITLEQELSHAQALLAVAEVEKRELKVKVHQLTEQVDAMHRYARDRMAAKHLIAWNTQDRVKTMEKMERMEDRMAKLEKENVLFRLRLREAGLPEK